MKPRARVSIALGLGILLLGAILFSARNWTAIATMERPVDERSILLWIHSENSRKQFIAPQAGSTDLRPTLKRLSGWQRVRRWPWLLDGTETCHGPYLVFWDGDPARPFRQGVYEDGFEVCTTQWARDGLIVWQVEGGSVNHGPDWWWGAVPWTPPKNESPRD